MAVFRAIGGIAAPDSFPIGRGVGEGAPPMLLGGRAFSRACLRCCVGLCQTKRRAPLRRRQPERERAAFPERALHPHLAVQLAHRLPDQREPEARATLGPRFRTPPAKKALEQSVALL